MFGFTFYEVSYAEYFGNYNLTPPRRSEQFWLLLMELNYLDSNSKFIKYWVIVSKVKAVILIYC